MAPGKPATTLGKMKSEDSYGKIPKRTKHKSSRVNDTANLNNFLSSVNIPLRSEVADFPAKVVNIGSPNGSVFDLNVFIAEQKKQPVTHVKKSNIPENAPDRFSEMQHFNAFERKDIPVPYKKITDLSSFGLTPSTTSHSTIRKDGKMAATCLLLN
jgi:hypothetical protein